MGLVVDFIGGSRWRKRVDTRSPELKKIRRISDNWTSCLRTQSLGKSSHNCYDICHFESKHSHLWSRYRHRRLSKTWLRQAASILCQRLASKKAYPVKLATGYLHLRTLLDPLRLEMLPTRPVANLRPLTIPPARLT